MYKKVNYKLIYVGFSFILHGKHSGYDYIKNVVAYDFYIDCQKYINFTHSISTKNNLFAKMYLILFGDRPWWIEVKCIFYTLFYRNLIFHFIYPEKNYRYFGFFKGRNNKIVCTLHLSPDFYKTRPEFRKGIKYIDKVIIMTPDMINPLKTLFKNSKFYFIPHGVDTTYFKPSLKKKDTHILMVGNWQRDFIFADSVFKQLISLEKNIRINVVAQKENHKYFDNTTVNIFSDITDDHLLDLYQSSILLFLPLTSLTANNALLEGAACGCKILIATNQQVDTCYIDKNLIDITPLNVNIVVNKILDLINNQDKGWDERITNYVETNYDWKIIGQLTEDAIRKNFD